MDDFEQQSVHEEVVEGGDPSSALRDNIARKGKNAYYYGSVKKFNNHFDKCNF